MAVVRTFIGAPGAGKTTLAIQWAAEDPEGRCRTSRDDLRMMLHHGHRGSRAQETLVTKFRDSMIRTAVRAGQSIVVDETNMRWQHLEHIKNVAYKAGAGFEVVSLLTVPLDVCVQRDAEREHPVGMDVVQRVWRNGVRNMIDIWGGLIADRLIDEHGVRSVTIARGYVQAASTDPLKATYPFHAAVVQMALDMTHQAALQYAPADS